jgi:orotate phosphoribosyltransferase-like protein
MEKKRRKKMTMLRVTPEMKVYGVIQKWIEESVRVSHSSYRYLTIRSYYDECELFGCDKFEVYWLTLGNLKRAIFYLDAVTHEVVHVSRYV